MIDAASKKRACACGCEKPAPQNSSWIFGHRKAAAERWIVEGPALVCSCGCGSPVNRTAKNLGKTNSIYVHGHNAMVPEVATRRIAAVRNHFAAILPKRETRLCNCGCKKTFIVSPSATRLYIYGHNRKAVTAAKLAELASKPRLCACGCDGVIELKRFHTWYKSRFLQGHHRRAVISKWLADHQGKYFCSCGCKSVIQLKPRHHYAGPPQYLPGHKRRKRHSRRREQILTPRGFSFVDKVRILMRCEFKCVRCGENDLEKLEFDHGVRYVDGGRSNVENGQALCMTCHNAKSLSEVAHPEFAQLPQDSDERRN